MSDPLTFQSRASELLGERGFTNEPDLMDPWLTDWRGRYRGKAIGIASPSSTSEVSEFVRLCSEYRVPIVPQGGNSGMSGGATPDESGTSVVVSLRRMSEIRDLDVQARQITCDAGVVLQTLHETVEAKALRFPLTLGGKGSATVGGLISTNAGGTQVLRHGTMRDQVLGLEVVLASGEILSNLVPLKKDNRGFDLKQLFIGAEGTAGIVTAATLRLSPAISERRVAWVGLASVSAAREFLLHCEREAGDALEGFEIVPDHCLQSVLAYLPNARSPLTQPHEWHALVEIVAERDGEQKLGELVETTLHDALQHGLIEDAAIAASETQAEEFWQLRESISPAERAIGPAMQHDISVPVDRMPEFLEQVSPLIERRYPGTRAIGFGHLGDGNIHYHVLAPAGAERNEWEASDGKSITRLVHDLVTEFGGSISAEHGIGQAKSAELERLADPVALDVMRRIKLALDPNRIMNPGKLLPLAPQATTP